MEQQTAVEWLISQIVEDQIIKAKSVGEWEIVFQKAKQMEKKQIMIAYMKNLPIENGVITAVQKAENYYNETIKNN